MKIDSWLAAIDTAGRGCLGMGAGHAVAGVWTGDFEQLIAGLVVVAIAAVFCNLEINRLRADPDPVVANSYTLLPFGGILLGASFIGEGSWILFGVAIVCLVAGVVGYVAGEFLPNRMRPAAWRRSNHTQQETSS